MPNEDFTIDINDDATCVLCSQVADGQKIEIYVLTCCHKSVCENCKFDLEGGKKPCPSCKTK